MFFDLRWARPFLRTGCALRAVSVYACQENQCSGRSLVLLLSFCAERPQDFQTTLINFLVGELMKAPRINWPIWAGLLLSVIAFLSYFFVFVWFPVTRDFPWVNLLLFALAALLLAVGVRRAFASERPRPTRSRVAAAVITSLSIAILGFFIFSTFINARRLPESHNAPKVGQRAPEFTLTDTNRKSVSLSDLLTSSVDGKTPDGVLLIFYRGHW